MRQNPVTAHTPGARPSRDERDNVAQLLSIAYAEGRLDEKELDERLHRALTTRTAAELGRLLEDLPGPDGPPRPAPRGPTPSDRGWAMLAHLLGLFTSFIGPLLVAFGPGRRSGYVRGQAVEALNFQLTFFAANLALPFAVAMTFGLAALFYIPLVLGWLFLTLAGAAGALLGDTYRYPFVLRLVR
ncbi:MAG: DUF1707 and DUF4870 domain-containing protein [Streptosporangiaceae bacterium]